MAANGAHTTVQTLKRDHSYLYSKQPPLNVTYEYYNDENVRDDIISLYEFFQLQFNDMNLLEILGAVVILFEQRFYLRVGTDYWKVKQVHSPSHQTANARIPLFGPSMGGCTFP